MNKILEWFGSFLTSKHIRTENDNRSRENQNISSEALSKAELSIALNNQLVQLLTIGNNRAILEHNKKLIEDIEKMREEKLLLEQKLIEKK